MYDVCTALLPEQTFRLHKLRVFTVVCVCLFLEPDRIVHGVYEASETAPAVHVTDSARNTLDNRYDFPSINLTLTSQPCARPSPSYASSWRVPATRLCI